MREWRSKGEVHVGGQARTLVSPGIGAVLHTRFLRSVLITELLPTLGYLLQRSGSDTKFGLHYKHTV